MAYGLDSCSVERLRWFAIDVLTRSGATRGDAGEVADALLWAEIHGVESHGLRLLDVYRRRLAQGLIVSPAPWSFVSRSTASAVLDAGNGFGAPAAMLALKTAMEMARQHGVGVVVVRNSNHFGAAGYYVAKAAKEGMVAVALANTAPAIAPTGGRSPYFGTNPIAIGSPVAGEAPLILDMATSVVAKNRILSALEKGDREIPEGWALDADGLPTTDPREALRGSLMPVGGHKGYGLAMFVDLLCGSLSGGGSGPDLGRFNFDFDRPEAVCNFFLAIDPTHFVGLENYVHSVRRVVDAVRTVPPAPGVERVMVPGEREARVAAARQGSVPLREDLRALLRKVASDVGIEASFLKKPGTSEEV